MNRTSCVVCGEDNLEVFLELERFPCYMGVSRRLSSSDAWFEQRWQECQACKGIQLQSPIATEVLYKENHHKAPVGKLWIDHFNSFADFINMHKGRKRRIIEIGAADGYLANLILEGDDELKYTVIEPSPSIKDARIEVIQGYLENHLDCLGGGLIIHSHVLEHLYLPRESVQKIANEMNDGDKMIFSIPNMSALLQTYGANSLNFEHTYFLNKEVVEYWAKLNDLQILESKEFRSHSIFFCVQKMKSRSVLTDIFKISENPRLAFVAMWTKIEEFVTSTNMIMQQQKKKSFLFGGHIFSQSLLAKGLKSELIDCILDNDIFKQGHRLYGTELIVRSPSIIKKMEYPRVILAASHYQNEIREQLIQINPNVEILELLN